MRCTQGIETRAGRFSFIRCNARRGIGPYRMLNNGTCLCASRYLILSTRFSKFRSASVTSPYRSSIAESRRDEVNH
jgi:hypothetical protein